MLTATRRAVLSSVMATRRAVLSSAMATRRAVLSSPWSCAVSLSTASDCHHIAETAITVDGVCWIVDDGQVKRLTYDPKLDAISYDTYAISSSMQDQRAGRVNRNMSGVYYSLFKEDSPDDIIAPSYV